MVGLLRFAVVVALGGIATAGLSACSGADAGVETVSPSVPVVVSEAPSVTPSVSPTPSATPEEELLARIPEYARYESFPSSVEFAMFFIDLYAPMFQPPYDTELFDFLCDDESVFCSKALENIAGAKEAGGYCEGGDFTWTPDLAVGGLQSDGYWYVTQDFEVTDTNCFEADGSPHSVSKGGTGKAGVKLDFADNSWWVQDVGFDYDDE